MEVYLYQGGIYCPSCARKEMDRIGCRPPKYADEFVYPVGPYQDGGGLADGPQVCEGCSALLHNPLTRDGYRSLALECKALLETGTTDHPMLRAWLLYCGELSPSVIVQATNPEKETVS